MNETTLNQIKLQDLNQKCEPLCTDPVSLDLWICNFNSESESFWPIWFPSQNLNDVLEVWDTATLPWNCSTMAASTEIQGKWLSLHHNLDCSSYSSLSFGHWCTRGPLCASISPPCRHVAITAHRAQWQKIIKWNVKSKGGQRMVFTTGLRVLSEMEKWIYCCYSQYWVDMLQIESVKYGMS